MDLVFLGTTDFGIPTLEALWREHRILEVYTQEPRPAGRGYRLRASPVDAWAQARGISVRTPRTLKDQGLKNDFHVDAAIVAAYGLIVPEFLLDVPRFGFLNIHGSLLPRWRGAAPIQRALLAGDAETGVTIFRMDAGIDTGPLLRTLRLRIADRATWSELHASLASLGPQALLPLLKDLSHGRSITPMPQIPSGVYAPKIRREEGKIRWKESAISVDRQVRALNPWPGAWFHIGKERIKIYKCAPLSGPERASPGTLLDSCFTVACGHGALRLDLVQRPGRAILDGEACLRGLDLSRGDHLDDG